MNSEFLTEVMFENKMLKCMGNEFQNLFYQVMKKYNKNFIEIKPQGSQGDRKCDGYIKNEGIFYQVYGPEDASNAQTQKYAISKLKEDFEGLYVHTNNGHYETVKEFHFVINTKGNQGIYPDLADKLNELSQTYTHIEFGYIDTNEIISIFMDLRSNHKRQILTSFIPDINFADIKFSIVQDIVSYLSKNVSRNIFTDHLIVPDFHKKIEFNNLSSKISNALEEADSCVYKLDEFLIESYSDTFKNELCHIYKTLYNESKELYPNNSDEQFKYILNSSYDKKNTLDIQTENQYISNILIIMAKYFSSCDIFEEPKKID